MSPTRHRRRRVVIAAALLVALGGAAAAVIATRPSSPSTASAAAASIFRTATVNRGDLTTSESVDGTLQLSSTLTVLHRIEGQTSSASASTPASTATSTPSARPTATTAPQASTASAALVDCPATSVPEAPATTTTIAGTTTTTPDTTPAATTTTTTTDPTTTTTVAVTPPPTTEPATTQPCPAPTTPDTNPAAPTSTDAGAGGARGGNGTAGGGGARTGSARGTTSSATSAASNARVTQTVTSIVAANSTVGQGDVLYTVDGVPVVALDGDLPAWRSMSTSSADGPDIAQLEAALVALGYDPAGKVAVDNHFDTATRTMVKAWQQGLGVEATGTVTLGSVVFLPAATTVSTVARAVGDTVGDGDSMMTLAAPTQQVLIDVPAGDEAQVVPGLAVTIGNVDGTVTRLRSADRNGAVVVEAVIAPSAPVESSGNGSSVKVALTLHDNTGALIAPAEALVSRLDGSYAVETKAADGTTKWLTVELLGVSGGNVAIRGDGVDDGTVVLLPA